MKKLAVVAFLLGMFGLVAAVDAADKNDPTGTWKIKSKIGKKDTEGVLKLEQKDGKVTGTISGAKGNEAKIEDGKYKDGELTFSVTRDVKDMKIVTKYSAKVDGDSMKGTGTLDFNGKEIKVEFEGTREKK
jgi:hypothetical protein